MENSDTTSTTIEPVNHSKFTPSTAWKPGQSGNPKGRPKKGTTMTDIMRDIFESNGNVPRAIVGKLLQMAADGDIAAIREVLDRIDGKVVAQDEGNQYTQINVFSEIKQRYMKGSQTNSDNIISSNEIDQPFTNNGK